MNMEEFRKGLENLLEENLRLIEESKDKVLVRNDWYEQVYKPMRHENIQLRKAGQQICDLPIESDFSIIRKAVMDLQNVLKRGAR